MRTPRIGSRFGLFAIALPGSLPTLASAAALIAVSSHTLTDQNAGTLLIGDQVMVEINLGNVGDATATATLSDDLTSLQQPANVIVDGFGCAGCSSTSTTLTVPLTIPQGSVTSISFTATVPSSLTQAQASSSATVAFSPADPGTSPTTPDVAILALDSIFRSGFDQ